MNKSNAAQYLPLVQALADGKVIQVRGVECWHDLDSPCFERKPEEYRIKPEPREWWVVSYVADGAALNVFNDEVRARKYANESGDVAVTHVREVTP